MKTIIKTYFSNIVNVFSGLITQLLFIKQLTTHVSSEDFSLYALVFQTVAYLNILQLGLDYSASREIAICLGREDYAGAANSFFFIKKINNKIAVIFIFILLIMAVLAYFQVTTPKGADKTIACLLTLLFGIVQVISINTRPYVAYFIGANRQVFVNLNNAIVNIIATLVATMLLVFTSWGLYAMPLALIVFGVINYYYFTFRFKKEYNVQKKEDIDSDKNQQQNTSIFQFSLMSTLGGLAWTVESTSDIYILSSMGYFNYVGFYVLWWRFPQMLFDLGSRFMTSSIPNINFSFGKGMEQVQTLFSKLFIIVILITLIIGCGISIWLPSFMNIWVGAKYEYENYAFLSFLIGGVITLRIIGNCFGNFLLSIGKAKEVAIVSWIQAFMKISLGLLLTPRFGLEGVIFSSIVASFSQVIIFGYRINKIFLFKNAGSFFTITLFPLVVSAISLVYSLPIVTNIYIFGISIIITAVAFFILWVPLFSYYKNISNIQFSLKNIIK